MPFLQIVLKQGLDEQEAQLALASICEYFPLSQSEGRVYRVATDFLLIEQPEHDVLTFEQELWLEQYQKAAHILHTRFYASEAEGCRLCNHPFDDSPLGFCQQCGTIDPSQTIMLNIPLTKAEDQYLTHLGNQGWGNLRLLIMAFLDLCDSGRIAPEVLLSSNAQSFTEKALALFHHDQTTCSLCGFPDEECTCQHSSFTYRHLDHVFGNLFEPAHVAHIALSYQDARRLQELADRYDVTLDTFVRMLADIPDLYLAVTSQEASAGRVRSHDFAFQLTQIAEQRAKRFAEGGRIRSIRDVDGNAFSPQLFHVAGLAASIAGDLPLLETQIPSLLFDQRRHLQRVDTLAWVKAQLTAYDADSAHQARPCTSAEIAALEALAGRPFPATYQAFLAWIGHGSGAFLQYLTCFYPSLPDLQTVARETLAHDGCLQSLPDDAWIISALTGHHFTFIRLSEGDNPPVYAYRSEWRRTPFCIIAYHLSDFFSIQVALYAEYLQHGPFQLSRWKGHRQRFLALAPRIKAVMADQQQEKP